MLDMILRANVIFLCRVVITLSEYANIWVNVTHAQRTSKRDWMHFLAWAQINSVGADAAAVPCPEFVRARVRCQVIAPMRARASPIIVCRCERGISAGTNGHRRYSDRPTAVQRIRSFAPEIGIRTRMFRSIACG